MSRGGSLRRKLIAHDKEVEHFLYIPYFVKIWTSGFFLLNVKFRGLSLHIIFSIKIQAGSASFSKKSLVARRVLPFIDMLGMCMLIDDGILTPAISVLSAMDDFRAHFPSVSKSLLEALSAAVLIVLFLMQKFGTSKVSFLFSPIMATWTFATPVVGIYSIIHYYPSIFKPGSPSYLYHYFSRNGEEGWRSLSGIVLCITDKAILLWLCFIKFHKARPF